MVANALCEITHQAGNRSAMMSRSIPFLGGAIMLTKQKLSKIADVALLSLLVLEAVLVTAWIAIPPASVQVADAQAQIDSLVFAPQRLAPDASAKTFRSAAQRALKGWIALHRPDGDVSPPSLPARLARIITMQTLV